MIRAAVLLVAFAGCLDQFPEGTLLERGRTNVLFVAHFTNVTAENGDRGSSLPASFGPHCGGVRLVDGEIRLLTWGGARIPPAVVIRDHSRSGPILTTSSGDLERVDVARDTPTPLRSTVGGAPLAHVTWNGEQFLVNGEAADGFRGGATRRLLHDGVNFTANETFVVQVLGERAARLFEPRGACA